MAENNNNTTATAATVWVADGGVHDMHPYRSETEALTSLGKNGGYTVREVTLLDGPVQEKNEGVFLILFLERVWCGPQWRLVAATVGEKKAQEYCAEHQTMLYVPGYGDVERYAYYLAPWGPSRREFDELREGVMRDLAAGLASGQVKVL